MYCYINCSRCGKRRRISTKKADYTRNVISQGWRSYGSALYCPDCSATWHERNSKELDDKEDTFWLIARRLTGQVIARTKAKMAYVLEAQNDD